MVNATEVIKQVIVSWERKAVEIERSGRATPGGDVCDLKVREGAL